MDARYADRRGSVLPPGRVIRASMWRHRFIGRRPDGAKIGRFGVILIQRAIDAPLIGQPMDHILHVLCAQAFLGKFETNEKFKEHTICFDNFDFQCIDDSGYVAGAGIGGAISKEININQIGYLPDVAKLAVLNGDAINNSVRLSLPPRFEK